MAAGSYSPSPAASSRLRLASTVKVMLRMQISRQRGFSRCGNLPDWVAGEVDSINAELNR